MQKKKLISPLSWIGAVVLFLSPALTAIFGLTNVFHGGALTVHGIQVGYGVRAAIANYGKMWNPSVYPHFTGVIGVFLIVLAIVFFAVEAGLVCYKKQHILLLNALARGLAIAYLPFLLILAYGLYASGDFGALARFGIFLVILLDLIGYILLALPYLSLLKVEIINKVEEKKEPVEEKPTLTEADVRRIADDRIAKLTEQFVSEERARTIAESEIAQHQEEFHSKKEEEQPAETKEEEPAEKEIIDDVAEEPETEKEAEPITNNAAVDDPFAALNKRRRAKFETRLKKADPELRAQYYELRDYIRSYGVKDRMSIPGITFSLHRDRYVFITIAGKKLKLYYALNPEDYANSTIPVIKNESKKFEDLPLEFKVKSGLSLKRAKSLVDDVMKAKGIEKPAEEK